MFKSYWTLAWRTLVRNKLYTLVNILGLALGICACLIIYLITSYEFSFDTFHPNRDRIFCVDATMGGNHLKSVPFPLPAVMRREMTGFQAVAAYQLYVASVTIPAAPDEKEKSFDDGG